MAIPQILPNQPEREKGRSWILGVEIFSDGFYNDEDFTRDRLRKFVDTYWETKDEVDPIVVTNHVKGINFGFCCNFRLNPAGYKDWLGNPLGAGQRIIADFLVDDIIKDDVLACRYRRPSIEIYPNYISTSGKKYDEVIDCVSIQGGNNLEAVRNLKPIEISARETEEALKQNKNEFSQALFFRANKKSKLIFVDNSKLKEVMKMEELLKAIQEGNAKLDQVVSFQSKLGEGITKLLELASKDVETESQDPPKEEMKQEKMADTKKCEDSGSASDSSEMADKVKKEFSDRIARIERENSDMRKALMDRVRMDEEVKPTIKKLADVKKFPKEVEAKLLSYAAGLDGIQKKKFSDNGKVVEKTQYEMFVDLLDVLPGNVALTTRQSGDFDKPSAQSSGKFDRKTFSEKAQKISIDTGKPLWQVMNEESEKLPADQFVEYINIQGLEV